MTRLLSAVLAALALAVATPALAGDCHGDCANCPQRKGAAPAGGTAEKDAAACACADGKECKCPQGCKCEHCGHKHDAPAPKAPAKT